MFCSGLGTGRLRSVRVLLLLTLFVPVVSGCTEAMTPAEPVTITFAYDGSIELYESLVQEFNQSYPHITVELDNSDGDEADVFMVTPFDLEELVEENAILSLDPFIEQDESFDLDDFCAGTVELYSKEGRIWAIPMGVIVRVLFYNQDLFDAYGVSYPAPEWTWDDFLNKSRALRDPEADIFAYAETNDLIDSLAFIYQHGGRIIDDMQNPTRMTFDDPLTIEALEWYAALIHEYDVAFQESQRYDVGGSLESGVYLGQIGMWTGWLAERGGGGGAQADWPTEWKMRWGMVPLPRDVRSATPAIVFGYAISSQSAHPEESWRWIAFLSQQVQNPYNMAPTRKSLLESDAYTQLVGSDVVNTTKQSLENAILFSSSLIEFFSFGIYRTALDDIIDGSSTPAEALSQAQRRTGQ
jgi:multiple sugar transport system substrate-binding protein